MNRRRECTCTALSAGACSEVDPITGAVRTTLGWIAGGAFLEDAEFVTLTAKLTDNAGKTGVAKRVFRISESPNGQVLTPQP